MTTAPLAGPVARLVTFIKLVTLAVVLGLGASVVIHATTPDVVWSDYQEPARSDVIPRPAP